MKIRNKIIKLTEELKSFEESLLEAKKDNKKHLIRRLELIVKDKKEKIEKLTSLDW